MHKKILSTASFVSLGALIEKIGAFLLISLLTAALSSHDFGSLMLAMTYSSLIVLFVFNGLQSSFFRWYGMWNEAFTVDLYEKAVIYVVISTSFLLISLLIGLSLVIDVSSLIGLDISLLTLVLISSIVSIFFAVKSSIWIINRKEKYVLFYALLKTILSVAIIYFLLKTYPIPHIRPLVEIGVVLIISSFFIYSYLYKYPCLFRSSELSKLGPVLQESLKYGWSVQVSQLAFWVITSSDRFFISSYLSNVEVGYYSILMLGTTLVFLAVAFNNSFSAYYNRMFYEGRSLIGINQYIYTYLLYAMIAIVFLKFFLFYFSDSLILLVSTSEYLVVSEYLFLTANIILYYFAYLLFSRYLHASKKMKKIIWLMVISALINLGLNFILVPSFGVLGALLASIIAYIFMASATLIVLLYLMGFHLVKRIVLLFSIVVVVNFMVDLVLFWSKDGAKYVF